MNILLYTYIFNAVVNKYFYYVVFMIMVTDGPCQGRGVGKAKFYLLPDAESRYSGRVVETIRSAFSLIINMFAQRDHRII